MPDPAEDSFVTVVTGLPRSGTSMVMQMLAAGGLRPVADEHRPADENNPRGYLEDERVKRLKSDNGWLGEARGRVVKVICQLVQNLPAGFAYRHVWVDRDLSEVLQSQRSMLARDAKQGAALSDDKLAVVFQKQVDQTKAWIEQQPNHRLLVVRHRELITSPADAAAAIRTFLGLDLDETAMAAAVDPSLYRSKT